VAALAIVAIAVIQTPIYILDPQPTRVIGHFTQLQSNKLLPIALTLGLIAGRLFQLASPEQAR
jgi:hypothetical protein